MKKFLLSFLFLPLLQGCADADDSSESPSSGYSLTDAGPGGPGGSSGSGSNNNPGGSSQAGVIMAGEWNDLRNWGF